MRITKKTMLVCCILAYVVVACAAAESQKPSENSSLREETSTPSHQTPTSPSPQPSPIGSTPTITPDDAYLFLLEIIGSNDECLLPCKAGIVPGRTTVSEAESVLSPLLTIAGSNSYFDDDVGSIKIVYPRTDFDAYIDIAFVHLPDENDNVISYLEFDVMAFQKIAEGSYEAIYDSLSYRELISSYSLQSIYSTYGLPNDIFTRLANNVGEETAPDYFYIWITYPNKGIYLRYEIQVVVVDDQIEVCPSNSFVTAWFLPTDRLTDHSVILSTANTEWSNIYSHSDIFKSVDDAFSVSPVEFFETLAKAPDQCFYTRLSGWPPP